MAVVDKRKIVMGGDSAGVDGYSLQLRADPKVFRNGDFLIGYTSSFRMGQLLRFRFTPPLHHPPDLDDYEYMATAFVDGARDCLKQGGFAKKEHETESGGTFLVGYRGRVYEIQDDYQVAMPLDGYAACGCGAAVALGALYATHGRPARERVETALKAAERMSAGVRAPFVMESL